MAVTAQILRPGVCRGCGCTVDRPCAGGCSWSDAERTICSRCVGGRAAPPQALDLIEMRAQLDAQPDDGRPIGISPYLLRLLIDLAQVGQEAAGPHLVELQLGGPRIKDGQTVLVDPACVVAIETANDSMCYLNFARDVSVVVKGTALEIAAALGRTVKPLAREGSGA